MPNIVITRSEIKGNGGSQLALPIVVATRHRLSKLALLSLLRQFFTLHFSLFTLHSSLFILHSSLFTLHSSFFTLHSLYPSSASVTVKSTCGISCFDRS